MKSSYQSYGKVVERLSQYREHLGVSQEEMGRYLGVTQSHYQKLEKGMKVISKKSLLTFEMSGHDVLWLLTGQKRKSGYLDSFLNEFDSAAQKRDWLEAIIWGTEKRTRKNEMEYDSSLKKAYNLMKISEYDEQRIWKKIREVENLTQVQMANLLEINIKRYRKIEKGEVSEDAAIFVSLYENLHYSPMLILNRERYYLDELNTIWSKFDKESIEKLLHLAEVSSDVLR